MPGADHTPRGSADARDGATLPSEDAARYIAEMTGELAEMARTSRLDLLAYLLEMAQAEVRRLDLSEGGPA